MATTYTTRQDETWDEIALKVYGNELLADQLMRANLKHIGTFQFDQDTVLTVPELEDGTPEGLPPWRD